MALALVLAAASSSAFEAPAPPAELPFEFCEGMLWVQVHVRGSAVLLSFLLDSGAGMSVINLPTLQRIGHLRGRRLTVAGVGATATGYWPQRLSLTAENLPLPKDFLAVDLSELSQACNRQVDGLIGKDFFDEHCVQIDFAAKKIRLLRSGQVPEGLQSPGPGRAGSPLPAADGRQAAKVLQTIAPEERIALPLKAQAGALRIPIRVNGGALQWVRLDTGCAVGLHWVSADIPASACHPTVSVALTSKIVPVTQTTVQIGTATFETVPTEVHQKPIFAGEAGLLGNGLLSRFQRVTVDAPAGRLILERSPKSPVETQSRF